MHVIFLRQSLVQNKKRKQWPYKPGSVPLPLTAAVSVIYLLRMSPHGSSILPSDVSMLSGGKRFTRTCSLRMARPADHPTAGGLLHTPSHPYRGPDQMPFARRSFSSAISCRHRQLPFSEAECPALPGLSSRTTKVPATDRTATFQHAKVQQFGGITK